MFLTIEEEICLERLESYSPPNGIKGWSVWSAALGGEFTGDPTSLAPDNIFQAILVMFASTLGSLLLMDRQLGGISMLNFKLH